MMIRNHYVTLKDAQIHLRCCGTNGPAIALFHQTPLSSRMYERALPALGKHMRAFAFDTPGYGNSSPLPDTPTLDGYADRLSAAIDSLGIEKLALGGFATGSAIALVLAQKLGERVTHLVLSGTPVLQEHELEQFSKELVSMEPNLDGSHVKALWQSRLDNYGLGGGLEQIQMATESALAATSHVKSGLFAVAQDDICARLSNTQHPTLFITLLRDKLGTANKKAASLVSINAREIIIEDAHPQYCWTDPDGYASAIFDFVLEG